ncbi:MAG: cytochrome c biogenesis protein CcsA [Chloroflexi bacterium]|nr:cytochrome c biogenesis protein CcsA [Chloroflexota bacterium]
MRVEKLSRTITILNILAFIALLISIGMVFMYAPVERMMGNVQRIFYFHVGTAWVGAIAFFVALAAGLLYLRKPDRKWDIIGLSSVEVGLVFLTITTAAGAIWGKPAWNTWWLWSPRLTLITIAWLTYAAYFMLRGAIEEEEKRGRFAAVYVIVAFVSIILAYISIRIWRDIHPVVFGGTVEGAQAEAQGLQDIAPGLDSMRMGITLTANVVTFSLIYAAWLVNRIRLQYLQDNVISLKMRVAARLQGGDV